MKDASLVGMTITAALTNFMSLTTYRGMQTKTIVLNDGKLTEHPIKKLSKQQHGLVVELIPSQKYLGEFHITSDMVQDYLRSMSYVVDPKITITLVLEDEPKKSQTTIYKAQGLSAAVKYMSSTLEVPPIEVSCVTDDFDISLAFSYDRSFDSTAFTSFCNYVITTEAGTHEQAAQRAICEFFTREAKKQDPNSRLEITYDDCKNGLLIAVNLEHINPEFEGQHKSKVSNKEVLSEGKKELLAAIYKIMNNNPGPTKKILNYLRNVAKARQESHKIKGISVKKQTTFLEDAEIPKFFPVTDRNGSGYRELYLAEGDSAAGGILNCRNTQYQAVLTVQGVTDNVHDLNLTQLLQKTTFRNLLTVLGCGVGKDFDISKLKYDKIIICTDSDIDGFNITSLLLCFFLTFTPDLIRKGKVYKAMPPLYLMDAKSLKRFYSGREWLYDKREYYDMYHSIIADRVELSIENTNLATITKGKIPKYNSDNIQSLKKRQLISWLDINSEYMLELDNLGKRAACNTTILEYVCYYKALLKTEAEFASAIIKAFPEMEYDSKTSSLIGSWNGEYFSLICDRIFMKSAKRYLIEMSKNPSIFVWFKAKNDSDNPIRCTIGEFLNEMNRTITLKVEQRFKGLGESEPDLLFSTTTNPKFRKLYRITIDDFKSAKEVFELLHGKSASLREQRRNFLDSASISYADIDN